MHGYAMNICASHRQRRRIFPFGVQIYLNMRNVLLLLVVSAMTAYACDSSFESLPRPIQNFLWWLNPSNWSGSSSQTRTGQAYDPALLTDFLPMPVLLMVLLLMAQKNRYLLASTFVRTTVTTPTLLHYINHVVMAIKNLRSKIMFNVKSIFLECLGCKRSVYSFASKCQETIDGNIYN